LTCTLHHCLSIAYLSIPCGQSSTDYVHMSGFGKNRTMRNRFIYLTHPSTSCLYYWDVFLCFNIALCYCLVCPWDIFIIWKTTLSVQNLKCTKHYVYKALSMIGQVKEGFLSETWIVYCMCAIQRLN
jgi:hypothetical protein